MTKLPEDIFDKFARLLNIHSSKAQIFIEVKDSVDDLCKVREILEEFSKDDPEFHMSRIEYRHWILLLIPIKNMQEIVLKLTQAGFDKINKGHLRKERAQNKG